MNTYSTGHLPVGAISLEHPTRSDQEEEEELG